ncbi:RNA polymerase sigma factor SigJ [Gimesia alba]|uniref:RNA polymerase sigma factor SigJ n=1 Tax=Gimesia alba TaxID=2527973 RepID=A0A517RFD7_9PLAN|nr:RNA polymerase sigma factor [Gimesia alba]QDT42555.1 RNA polymerase sigma factor SigJ [Gimesia alba]
MNIEEFNCLFLQKREQLLSYAGSILKNQPDAEDIVQRAYLNISKLVTREVKDIRPAYLFRTVQNLCLNHLEKTNTQVQGIPFDLSCSETYSSTRPEFNETYHDSLFVDCSPLEESVFRQRLEDGESYQIVGDKFGISYGNTRQLYHRAKSKVELRLICNYFREGQFSTFNSFPLLNEEQASKIAEFIGSAHWSEEALFAALENRVLNNTIKNTVMILRSLLPKQGAEPNSTEKVLIQLLGSGRLYRGQNMYIAEALIDHDYRRHIHRFRRSFLERIHEMDDRPATRQLTRKEKKSRKFICLHDLKSIRNIGQHISEAKVREFARQYETGTGSVDINRCLSLQLTRLHPDNEDVIRTVVNKLYDEPDQTNACYVISYLRTLGPRDHPSLYTSDLLKVAEKTADQWSGNAYLEASVRHLHQLVNRVTAG